MLSPAGRRRAGAAAWLAPLVLAGGYWYLRNLIAVGNPLPWTSFAGILPTPVPPLQQNTGFSLVHYLTDTHVWTHLFGPGLVVRARPVVAAGARRHRSAGRCCACCGRAPIA